MTRNAPDLSGEEPDTLVALARRGNDQAFAELVIRHQSRLRNLLRRLSNDPALADDLAQQAFLEAWRSIKSLRSSGAFGAWLKKVAINAWLKHSRSKDPLNAVEDKKEVSAIVERSSIDEEIDLDRALAALSKPERLCIVLSYHQGMGDRWNKAQILAYVGGFVLACLRTIERAAAERGCVERVAKMDADRWAELADER